MANKIQWVMEMVDKISGPAKSAGSSLGNMIQVTHSALAAVQLIGQAAVSAGHMIASGLEPAISKEKSLGAFETLLGNAEQARKMYGEAVKFAAETPFETAQVVDSFQKLLTAKFSEEETPIALRIIGDAGSMQEDSAAAVASVTRALSQIRSKGRLQGEELMQIQEAVPLNTAALYEKLGALYGVNADKARKMQEAGQIDAQAASFAILEQLSAQFGGNMEKASRQVGGLVSTLQSRPAEFLAKLQDTKGYDALRDVLGRMASAFDPETSGLTPFLTQLGSGVLERASVALDYLSAGALKFMEGLSAGLGPLGESFGPTSQTDLEKFKILMEGLGTATGKVAAALKTVSDIIKPVWNFFYSIGEWIADKPWLQRLIMGAGGAIAGLKAGIVAGGTAGAMFGGVGAIPGVVIGGGIGLVGGGAAGAFAPEMIASVTTSEQQTGGKFKKDWIPPQQSMVLNNSTAEEMAAAYGLPAFAEGGIVRKPTVALIGESGPEAVVPLSGRSGGSGGSVTVHAPISLTFQGAASASDAQAVAAAVGPAVEAHLFSVLERLALQSGRYA